MKLINDISDLKRVYRIKDLLEQDIKIDFIKLLSKFLGEDYNKIENSYLLKVYFNVLNETYTNEQKKDVNELNENEKNFANYLKENIGNDIFRYISENNIEIKNIIIPYPEIFKHETLMTFFGEDIYESKF